MELELSEEAPAENQKFVEQSLPHLCPMLLETLLKQEEGTEGDDTVWNINTAGGTCLGLVANTVGNALVPLILPFMQVRASLHFSAPPFFDSVRTRKAARLVSPVKLANKGSPNV